VNSTRESDFASPPSARWIVVRNSVAAWGIKVLRSCERGARKTEIADIWPPALAQVGELLRAAENLGG
jgi:hypothetical protein